MAILLAETTRARGLARLGAVCLVVTLLTTVEAARTGGWFFRAFTCKVTLLLAANLVLVKWQHKKIEMQDKLTNGNNHHQCYRLQPRRRDRRYQSHRNEEHCHRTEQHRH